MKKRSLLITLAVCCFCSASFAAEITKFNNPSLMELFDSKTSDLDISDTLVLPIPPVKIVGEYEDRYAFNINEKLYWISGIDVRTDGDVVIESLCNNIQLAGNSKEKHYGVRGAGIGCKK